MILTEVNLDIYVSDVKENAYASALETSVKDVISELIKAKQKYKSDFNSLHEAYAVMLEESDELWTEIKTKNPDLIKVISEAIQLAAMALRLITELT